MKHSKILIALTAGLAFSIPAHAEKNSWYVGASLSTVDLGDVDTQSTAPVAGVNRNLDIGSDSDTGFGIKIGKTVLSSATGSLDIELNYSQSDHDVDSVVFQGNPFTGAAVNGELEADSLLIRAAYKFNTGGPVRPYIGVGIGIVDLSVDAQYGGSIGQPAGTPPFAAGSDEAFALEFRIGADWEVNKKWSLFAEYSYTDISDVNFGRLGGGPGGLAITNQEGDFDLQAFTVGVNYRF